MATATPGELRKPSRLWRIGIYATVVIWGLFFLLRQCNFDLFTMSLRKDPWVMSFCDRYLRASAESPDRASQAIMVDFACGALGGAGTFTGVAVVKSGSEPSEADQVAGISQIYGEHLDVTKLEWKSDQRLKITLPQGTQLYDLKSIHKNIAIEIQYTPSASLRQSP